MGNTGSLPSPGRPGYRLGQHLTQLFTIPQTRDRTLGLGAPIALPLINHKPRLRGSTPESQHYLSRQHDPALQNHYAFDDWDQTASTFEMAIRTRSAFKHAD